MAIGPWAALGNGRRGMVALCVVGSGLLATVASLMTGGCAAIDERAALRIGHAAVIAAADRNGDGALDRSEVTLLVEEAVPAERTGPGGSARRSWLGGRRPCPMTDPIFRWRTASSRRIGGA